MRERMEGDDFIAFLLMTRSESWLEEHGWDVKAMREYVDGTGAPATDEVFAAKNDAKILIGRKSGRD